MPLTRPLVESTEADITDDPRRNLRGRLEAVLFVGDEPIEVAELGAVVGADTADIQAALQELSDEYDRGGRGIDLRQVAGGWRLFTSDRYADVVERFVVDGQQARLTQAALETLAVVAYRQPVTRARVAAIRGVGVDGVFRTLAGRGLIEECGSDVAGGAHLYRTTPLFLEKLGINDLTDLPSLAPLLPEANELDDVSSSS
ncbi:MAG: SMC-Scp complex subunit ScpB [Pseudonocardiales bacterium]|nr:MAG: SMC-Scp complex subunit ScpB [Pseudonocardiales bacterium]